MKQRYIGRRIRGGPIFHFLWSSSEFLTWDVTEWELSLKNVTESQDSNCIWLEVVKVGGGGCDS